VTAVDVDLIWANEHVWGRTDWVEVPPIAFPSLWYVTEGEVDVRVHEEEHRLPAGSWALWPADHGRSIRSRNPTKWFSLGVRARMFGSLDIFEDRVLPCVWQSPADADFALALFTRLLTEWGDGEFITRRPSHFSSALATPNHEHPPRDRGESLIVDGAARTLLGLVWQALDVGKSRAANRHQMPRWLRQSLQTMQKNPSVKPGMLADQHAVSPAHFRRTFQQYLGTSPQEHLTRLRLDEARNALLLTDLPIAEVATLAGFDNPVHFTKIFKKRTGQSPSNYRQTAQPLLTDRPM
jgi:AraC-like DNA-binding protein